MLETDLLSDDSYTYHGDDGGLESWNQMFSSRQGDGGGDPEEDFLSAIRLMAACRGGGAFLDIGTGVGRIVDVLRPYAGRIVGLEPDRERYLGCKNGFSVDRRIEMFNLTSWEYRKRHPRRRFDFITVSMVIQHISTKACSEILDDVRAFLAPGGMALISTTHFYEERFTYENDPWPHAAEEFDRYTADTSRQDKGIPVRMFSRTALELELERAGLEAVVWRQFAYPRSDRADEVATFFAGPVEQMRDRGVSQYVAARRAGPPRRGGLAGLLDR